MKNNILTKDVLEKIEKESEAQDRPDQKGCCNGFTKA